MSEKKSPSSSGSSGSGGGGGGSRSLSSSKRPPRKMFLEDLWDCSICTYRNKAEAFKCSICDARKGTSTRKPRINPQQLVVAQQVQAAVAPKATKPKQKKEEKESRGRSSGASGRLKDMDSNNDIQTAITVNGITVVITEFKPKSNGRKRTISENSNGSSDGGGTAQHSDDDYEPPNTSLPQPTEKSSP